jgi:hypothetical protein
MARPYGSGRPTCESCKSIDVRRWHRDGRLRPGQYFSWSWSRGGEPSGNINVRTDLGAVVLMYRSRSYGDAEWKSVEQRVLIAWTACHLGGRRPWFVCSVYSSGRYCGRRVGATVWRMRASMKTCTTAASERHRKYECNWGEPEYDGGVPRQAERHALAHL